MTSEDQIKAVLAKHIKPWEMDGFPCVTGIPEAAAEIAALASTAGAGTVDWVTAERAYKDGYENGAGCYIGDGSPEGMALAQGQSWDLYRAERLDNAPAVPASPRSGAGEGEEGDVWTLERAFDLGFSWGTGLYASPQNMEDSRAVGRTLLSSEFDGLDIDIEGWRSFESGDLGVCEGKARIKAALRKKASPPAPAEHGVEIREAVEAAFREGWRVNAVPACDTLDAREGFDCHPEPYLKACEDADWDASSACAALSQGGGAGRSEKGEGEESRDANAVAWAVTRWRAEVENRPLQNVHRRGLDTTWRQVIRHFGGIPEDLIGPSHDDLIASAPAQSPSTSDAEG